MEQQFQPTESNCLSGGVPAHVARTFHTCLGPVLKLTVLFSLERFRRRSPLDVTGKTTRYLGISQHTHQNPKKLHNASVHKLQDIRGLCLCDELSNGHPILKSTYLSWIILSNFHTRQRH